MISNSIQAINKKMTNENKYRKILLTNISVINNRESNRLYWMIDITNNWLYWKIDIRNFENYVFFHRKKKWYISIENRIIHANL